MSAKKSKCPTLVECDECHGSGARSGTSAQTCPTCHGSGQVQMRQGFFAVTRHARIAMVKVRLSLIHAVNVHGDGRVQKTKTLSVKSRLVLILAIVFVGG